MASHGCDGEPVTDVDMGLMEEGWQNLKAPDVKADHDEKPTVGTKRTGITKKLLNRRSHLACNHAACQRNWRTSPKTRKIYLHGGAN